jgi:replicative DNA helicase
MALGATPEAEIAARVAVDAEIAVLAAALSNVENFHDVSDLITVEDFSHPAHAAIYEAMQACDAEGRTLDILTVSDAMRRLGTLERYAGSDLLDAILGAAGSTIGNTVAHAEMISDRALRRRVLSSARDIATEASAAESTGAGSLSFAEQSVFSIIRAGGQSNLRTIAEALPETLAQLANASPDVLLGQSTGFAELDSLTAGLQGGQLMILAGRPGMGKSALAVGMARHVAETSGDMVVILNYEMSSSELLIRMLASSLGIDVLDLRRGQLTPEAERDLASHAQRLAALPILIDDNPPATIAGVRSSMRRVARRGPLALIVVDYLQLLSGESNGRGEANRTQEVSTISRGMKVMSRELDVPVMALSQLSRALESRPDRRPRLSDLRESGSLEQDADMVLFVYRDGAYYPEADPTAAELILAKQRSGPSGVTVHAVWEPQCARFSDPGPSQAGAGHQSRGSRPAPRNFNGGSDSLAF